MTPISLKNHDWFDDPAAQKILAVLGHDAARFVGGCVRNGLLGHPVHDVDIATLLSPDAAIKALENKGIKAIPTGVEHGTVTALLDGKHFEITTLRRDVETDGRHAVVAFTDDWKADSDRRDFTMNALYMDALGVIYDYHNGLNDLQKGHVRFIGEADTRLHEDVLRILRFFRFSLYYGGGVLDDAGLAACIRHKDRIQSLSRERVRDEYFKILNHEAPIAVLRPMYDSGILTAIASFLKIDKQAELFMARDYHLLGAEALFRLAVMAGQTDPKRIFDSFRLSRDELKILQQFQTAQTDNQTLEALFYYYGEAVAARVAILNGVEDRVIKPLLGQTSPRFPLSGKDMLDAGFAAGPVMGDVLKALENWWVKGGFKADKQACLAHAKTLLKA